MKTMEPTVETHQDFRLATAGAILLGMGFAGFFDGIVLHQVLQWHHLLTSVRPTNSIADLEANTFWDGIFHLGAYGLTIASLILLWRASQQSNLPKSPKFLIGSVLFGFGSFNLIEGLINHQILGIHHVKYGAHQFAWDMGFLAVGILFIIVGWLVFDRGRQESFFSSKS
ncbi:DUF2243 domain-containing protein [Phormidesmis priestleyi]